MPPKVHLALVSAQAAPNITPVLDPAFQPEEVILLVSADMTERADWLTEVLRPRGVRVSRWPIHDPWGIDHVAERVWALVDARSGEDLALNATGGTKPMSIAAVEVFRDWDLPIFYVHPEKDRVIWLHPRGREGQDLEDRIRLEAFLQAYGARVEGKQTQGVPPVLGALTGHLVERSEGYAQALGTLNWLAHEAGRGLLSPRLDPRQQRGPVLDQLIERFEAAGLLSREGERLRFPDEAARFYVNGGWLEEHVYQLVRELRTSLSQIQDLARGVEIVRRTPRGDVRNELDVALLADNRLYIIECKTRRWGDVHEGGPGAGALYRLDTVKDLLGGLQARAMLISYREFRPEDRQRAADLGIKVCSGRDLRGLRSRLSSWIR